MESKESSEAMPQMVSDLSGAVLLDTVVSEVFGAAKFRNIKAILDANEIQNLVDLAMYECDELLDLQGSVPSTSASGGFETISLSKTQAKKLSLFRQWYKSQPNPTSATWLLLGKDKLDEFILGN